LRAHDDQAWQEFVELYAELIFNWCRISRLSSADSADIMQEVFASVAGNIANFERSPGSTMRGWLWTITKNKIRDHFRKRNIARADGGTSALDRLYNFPEINESVGLSSSLSTNDPCDNESSATAISMEHESNRLLHRAMKQIQSEFSERSWNAFWRSVVDGQETRFIAEDLGITTAGVRQAKRRILRRLRQQLGDLE
jgi:RNA polymerase sigma-70 factor (ECF subfamily)